MHAEERNVIINDNSSDYNPALASYYLIDTDNKLKIDEILSQKYQDSFIVNEQEILHYGLVSSTIWIKFNVQSFLDSSPYLEIENPALDTIEYFLFNNEDILVHHAITGNHLSIEQRNIESGELMIDMQLKNSEAYTCYLKINASSSSILAPLRIASLKSFYELKHSETIWQGVYFGLILFLFIYNIFLFISLKDSTYIYFALFIACLGLLFALFKGFGMHYIWNSFPEINQLTPLLGASAGIFMILFSVRFLNSREITPKLYYWLLSLIGFYSVIIILNVLGFQFLSINLIIFNSMTGLMFLMIVAVKSWKLEYEPAKYYLFAWSFYVIGIFTSFMRDKGYIEVDVFSGNILQITSTVSILFMSFALSKRINIYIKNKNIAQDIAVKAALENEKLISNQNVLLEAKVHQRTIDLEETISTLSKHRKELHEANGFKDKVLSIISHDLKSPIATLAGMLNVMKLSSLSELERAHVIDKLEVALKNTKNLLDNILAWANKSDKNSKETGEVELHSGVNEIFDLFQYQALDKKITLKNQTEDNFHINVNKNMFQLVLRNLVSNAIKFTPKNGEVIVSMKEEFQNLKLEVKDSGIGMSPEIQASLFLANKHTSTRGTDNEKGTGLGLKLCKEFVDKFNGELTVYSEQGKGTTFTVKLKDAIPILETVFN